MTKSNMKLNRVYSVRLVRLLQEFIPDQNSRFVLQSLDSLVEVIHNSLLSHSLHFFHHCLMIVDTRFLDFFYCWLISWLVDTHCLSLIYSCYVFINKLTLCAALAHIALVLTDRTHQLLAYLMPETVLILISI